MSLKAQKVPFGACVSFFKICVEITESPPKMVQIEIAQMRRVSGDSRYVHRYIIGWFRCWTGALQVNLGPRCFGLGSSGAGMPARAREDAPKRGESARLQRANNCDPL